MVMELARRVNVDPHWLATGERMTESKENDLRQQLQAAWAENRTLQAKLDGISAILAK
jgi:hypothetical protein